MPGPTGQQPQSFLRKSGRGATKKVTGGGVRRAAISSYRSHARQQWEIAHWFRLLEPASGVSARPGHQGTGRAWPFRHVGPSIALDPKEQKSATLDRYYTQ